MLFRCNGVHLPPTKLSHLVKGNFSQASQVLNSVVYLNNLTEEGLDHSDLIYSACAILKSAQPDLEEPHQQKLAFILEQLELLLKEPKRRRYSSFLIACAVVWQNTSPALYYQILNEGVLTLPAVSYLKQLSSALSVDAGLSQKTVEYLKKRTADLTSRERLIGVIIDEVYCAKRVEFAGGKLFGLENESASKTLLCFMIRSVAGKYRDMVAMHPISKIDSSVIEKFYQQVLSAVTDIGLTVVSVSTDGHSANRKFFEQLCGGKIAPLVEADGEKIHLLFDPVHLFKNFYTNFLNRTILSPPNFEGKQISANFNHISQLYHHEQKMSVKAAHKLTLKVLSPRPIERCNVMLAERLFHESTIAALRFYGDKHPEWKTTADFLDIIHRWWSIVNVRTPSIGIRKRDDQKKPISNVDCSQMKFMSSLKQWFEEWRKDGDRKSSISRETLFCAIQTTSAIPELVQYLLEDKMLSYVLLGKINSDPIERRFGHYRQLSGANYFLSVRQFLEAEKAIRIRSLVKYSKLVLSEVTADLSSSDNSKEQVQDEVQVLLSLIEDKALDFESTEDGEEAIVYYVAGYVARSLLKVAKCQGCVRLISESDDVPPVLFMEESDEGVHARERFLEQVTRGGLIKPSDLLYIFCLHAHQLHKVLFSDDTIKNKFISSHLPRAVFSEVLKQKLGSEDDTRSLVQVKCSMGHDMSPFLEKAGNTFCNCMLKNYVSEVNDQLHEGRKRKPNSDSGSAQTSSSSRKISKLQGKK